jgi:TonB family protein
MTERAPDSLSQPGDEPRGLEWYLKARGIARQSAVAQAPAAVPASSSVKPELMGWEQASSPTQSAASESALSARLKVQSSSGNEEKKEAELFAYIDGQSNGSEEPSEPRMRLRMGPIIGALILAAVAISAAPQAPWHPQVRAQWLRGQKALHAWLNPQPLTPTQAPPSHENFARAGDEYKLPVVETIPDATTDPSQIRVVPVIDPTAKKPTPEVGNAGQAPPQPEMNSDPFDPPKDPGTQSVVAQDPTSAALSTPATTKASVTPTITPAPVAVAPAQQLPETAPAPMPVAHIQPPKIQRMQISTPGNIPSSLKSQMASATPEAGGNKAPEAALPSIEPVAVAEGVERSLLLEEGPLSYPESAKGQTGTVILQVSIGRDGAVQDAKFLQGSLAFARSAIDGVKLWKFKPYLMNGRPASVQTLLTIHFKPSA